VKHISLAPDNVQKLELETATLGETNRSRFVASLIAEVYKTPLTIRSVTGGTCWQDSYMCMKLFEVT